MVNENEINETPKKRNRLFGGRKSSPAPEHSASAPTTDDTVSTVQPEIIEADATAAETTPPEHKGSEPTATETTASEPNSVTTSGAPRRRAPVKKTADVAAEGTDSDGDAAVVAPKTRRAAPKKSVQDEALDASVDEESHIGNAPMVVPAPDTSMRRTPALPTTSLLFQAPDLPPLPARAPARRDEPNRRDDRRDEQNRRDDRRDDQNRRDDRRDEPNRRADQAQDEDRRDESVQDDESQNVRRRSRRRPGEEPREGDTDPGTVVKVRQPRKQPEPITEPQRIKGSTRLEAKKQRRRDGRDAGRRRPVITEAEFLARRESVDRVMVVRSKFDRTQIAVLEDGVLVEHYVAKAAEASLIGNVYLGRVQNVLPSMEAAFVDIGRGRNAVLYSGEVDWEAAAAESSSSNQPRRIELALKPGDRVLVQVTKDPIGHKGARLTSQISLPGRYLVYVPNGSMNGISRKLPDAERARLKKILKEVLPDNAGVIVRTAAEGATDDQLTLDVNRLTSQWAEISRLVETSQAPVLLHSEPDLLVKIVRDVFNEDFQKLVIAGPESQVTIENYLRSVAPDLLDRVESYEGDTDSFDAYRITEQIEKALDRKVWLPSGGSLVIDRTEAMTVVDVNTGKFVGSGGNLEETVTKNNLESAEEIVRQLRLRDIGGIIVVDFIDMVLESNRDLVLRRLVECLSRDRTKHQVAEVTSLGLVQMTRKKLGLGLIESFSEPCEQCAGRGIVIHHDPVTKHRQTPQQQPEGSGRGRRGNKGPATTPPSGSGRNGGNGNGGNTAGSNGSTGGTQTPSGSNPPTGVTHAITEDVRKALAQVAASTLHAEQASAAAQENNGEAEQAASTPVVDEQTTPTAEPTRNSSRSQRINAREINADEINAQHSDGTTDESTPATTGGNGNGADKGNGNRERKSRNGRNGRAPEPTIEDVTIAAAESAVAILDIPVTKSSRSARRISTHDAEQILDSVLEALPEPKQPGQGRSRVSRRASSSGAGIITTESKE